MYYSIVRSFFIDFFLTDFLGDCEWRGEVCVLLDHFETDCEFFPVVCPLGTCNAQLVRITAPLHIQMCPHKVSERECGVGHLKKERSCVDACGGDIVNVRVFLCSGIR